MDRVIPPPKVLDGFVWLTVRVDSYRYEVGAARPGEWVLQFSGPPDHGDGGRAVALAKAYEIEHAAELAPLFAQAEAFRAAQKP